jgi:conjugation transfer TcpE-like protein
MTIHSYRRVLKVRRHIHVIPWSPGRKLVLPYPIPVLGVVYFVALEAAFFVISRLPLFGLAAKLPFKVWWIIPLWLAWLAVHTSFDGRMPHLWVLSWIQFRLRPKRTRAGLRVKDGGRIRGRVRWWVDEHAPDLHRARIAGPAAVQFNVPVRYGLALLHNHFEARPGEYEPTEQVHKLAAGERLEVKR